MSVRIHQEPNRRIEKSPQTPTLKLKLTLKTRNNQPTRNKMKSILYPSKVIRALAVLAAAGALSINAHADCNINMGSTSQTIDGFGFSSAWCGTL
jgi:hypothetical protein